MCRIHDWRSCKNERLQRARSSNRKVPRAREYPSFSKAGRQSPLLTAFRPALRADQEAASHHMSASRILIADDERHIRLALSLLLRQEGYLVEVAANGVEAFQKITCQHGFPFELLITDLQMPALDGLGLIDRLAQQQISIPVIVITGYGNGEVASNIRRRNCAAYVDKPFLPEDILRHVSEVLCRTATVS